MLKLIVKIVVVISGLMKLIAYWVAIGYFLVGQNQVKDASTVIGGLIGVIIVVMFIYYCFYWLLFLSEVPPGQCDQSRCSECLCITCKRSFPLMIFSSLGLMQLMVGLKLYRFLLCQGDDPPLCRKVAFGIISGLGSMFVMGFLITGAMKNTSSEAAAYYKVTQIFGYIAIGFTILGEAVNQSANNFNLCGGGSAKVHTNSLPNGQSTTDIQQ